MRPLICVLYVLLAGIAGGQTQETAWKPGYPAAGLVNSAELIARVREKATHLKGSEKVRILIIGDSLSAGAWAYPFRDAMQAAYGDGGKGAYDAGSKVARGGVGPPVLTGVWRYGWGSRGDIWPYLGWNGQFLASDDKQAALRMAFADNHVTAVYSTGTFEFFDGTTVSFPSGGWQVRYGVDRQVVAPATEGGRLGIGLLRIDGPPDGGTLEIDGIHDGTLFLHGFLMENDKPGVVVYNFARGGYWWFNYLYRQPGFDGLLQAIKPDLTIVFLSKPDSESAPGSEGNPNRDRELLIGRLRKALPDTELLQFVSWHARDGTNSKDLEAMKAYIAWLDRNGYAYLNLRDGLDPEKMKQLGWYTDNIHIMEKGGVGIGVPIANLFAPGKTPP